MGRGLEFSIRARPGSHWEDTEWKCEGISESRADVGT